MKKTTINDIARTAGVSKTTVSRFLNQKYNNMSVDTKKKIEQTIEDLNYQPNRSAQSLKNHRSYLIGISVADISNPYTSRLLKGINDAFANSPYQVMIMDADNSTKIEFMNIQKLIADEADAVIIQPLTNDINQYQNLIDSKILTIQVDRYIDQHIWPSVVSDNYDKSFIVGQILQDKGYEHIIVLTNNTRNISSRKNRVNGLTTSLVETEITVNVIDIDQNDNWQHMVINQINANLKCAIYALNGEILWEVIRFLRKNQLDFPNDVGVIGYDDNGFADLITPNISAIIQHPLEIGQTAASKILDALNNASPIENVKTKIPSTIENRESL
ncbi:transcriptional regulator [Weissella oryzae SG25]|uniref:Transcriptional regulator n=1 Tax=Weissella oryzae (strain DSM 25784 / JCM 18191 / LMG 30913 / SG25) TaxID=1329250 RepID=A0A069CX84_WEIOS|nr:LacI family DNA-binding transcriptional regulator [Weissella oryzae]GAK31793.1 transcriptional regulator [Weissella oryzae SG25]